MLIETHQREVRGAPDLYDGDHAVVHQATGIVKVQLGVNIAEALVRLRAHAYAAGRSIEDVARDVVGRRLRFNELSD